MAERDGLALALGELGDPCHQRPILDPFLSLMRGVLLRHGLALDGPAQPVAPPLSPEVVERSVARNPEEPCGGGRVARLEPGICLVRVHEHLGRDVLGVGRAPHLRPDVGVDPSQVFPVQVFEGRPVGEHGRFMVGARTIFEPTPGQAAL